MSRSTMLVAIDDDEMTYSSQMSTNSAWIDIKELMLRHFLPEEGLRLLGLRAKIVSLERQRSKLNKSFENAFLIANYDSLKQISEYS